MNLKSTIVFFTSVAICFQLSAQCNYINKQYNVSKESNVLFGNDISYDGVATDLFLNIFKPVNDFNTKRPILLLIHGGGFTGGTKEEMDSMCYWYAQRGYVTATMSYRLGFYGPRFLSSPFAFDSAEVIRAAFRGVQDAHGALRFMKGRAAIDSTDVNLAFVGGASAGAITALHLTYADKAWESPPAVDSISNVINSFVNKQRPFYGSYNWIVKYEWTKLAGAGSGEFLWCSTRHHIGRVGNRCAYVCLPPNFGSCCWLRL
ncbi:MAG: carboxylesterase family protein [Bacteroidetes bacterium]|nr:carboxylesterase family protein [Bacteroidota bacterium]